MSFPLEILSGSVAIAATAAAALSPESAADLSEVGFLRWALVGLVVSGGALAVKFVTALNSMTDAVRQLQSTLDDRAERDHAIIAEIVKESLKP